jgi:hypothetical protein
VSSFFLVKSLCCQDGSYCHFAVAILRCGLCGPLPLKKYVSRGGYVTKCLLNWTDSYLVMQNLSISSYDKSIGLGLGACFSDSTNVSIGQTVLFSRKVSFLHWRSELSRWIHC